MCENEVQKTGLNFGQAIGAIKDGKQVARENWNGKDMFLFINLGSYDNDNFPNPFDNINGVPGVLFQRGDKGTITRFPTIWMRSAQGHTYPGWTATQADMLAIDWFIVE